MASTTKDRAEKWLARNKAAIGSSDGYPAEFHRKWLFSLVTPGCQVAWLSLENPLDKNRIPRPPHRMFQMVPHPSAIDRTEQRVKPERRILTGRVQILTRGSHAAVLVTNSSGARPAMVDASNIVWCSNAPYRI